MSLKYCAHPGCHKLTSKSYCSSHAHLEAKERKRAKAGYDTTRPSAQDRGYDRQWSKLSRMVLARHPLCQVCHRQASRLVHHIAPVGEAPDLRLRYDNCLAVCFSCHQALHRQGQGRGYFNHANRAEKKPSGAGLRRLRENPERS
jgi:5-methylcytosine-specific restriction protein A